MTTKSMEAFDLSWPLFEIYNSHTTKAFEQMCLDLFYTAFVQEGIIPHTEIPAGLPNSTMNIVQK